MYFLGRVAVEKHSYMLIDYWQWNPYKQCWYTTLSDSRLYSAKLKCSATADYEDPSYLNLKLKGTDNNNNLYVFSIKQVEENAYSIISSSNFFACSECHKMISVNADRCPHCGVSISYICRKYFEKFLNIQALDLTYKKRLIDSLNRNAVYSEKTSELSVLNLDEIEKWIEKKYKIHSVSSISKEYLDFYNYIQADVENLNLWEIHNISMDCYEYRKYRDKILEELIQKATAVFKKAYISIVEKIIEKENQKLEEKIKQAKEKLKEGEHICLNCGKIHFENKQYCSECMKYYGLKDDISKLDVNNGAFNRNAKLYGYYMRPVGVSDYDAQRFQNRMKYLDIRLSYEDAHQFDGIENMTNPKIINKIKKYYITKKQEVFKGSLITEYLNDKNTAYKYLVYLILQNGHPHDVNLKEIQEFTQYCLMTYKSQKQQ